MGPRLERRKRIEHKLSNGTELRTFDVTNASSGTNAFFFWPGFFIAPKIQLPACHAGLATLPPMFTEQAIEAHKATQTAAAEVHEKRGFR
jgi:hypothetical protein